MKRFWQLLLGAGLLCAIVLSTLPAGASVADPRTALLDADAAE